MHEARKGARRTSVHAGKKSAMSTTGPEGGGRQQRVVTPGTAADFRAGLVIWAKVNFQVVDCFFSSGQGLTSRSRGQEESSGAVVEAEARCILVNLCQNEPLDICTVGRKVGTS